MGFSISELLGYVSISCWLGAQFPQILENIKQQSCESLALPFLFNWMLGDASNLIGCLLTHQLPFQTYLATYFCFVDCCLLYQYFYFGGGPQTPPLTNPRARSRTTSSARHPAIDTSHYRTLSTTRSDTHHEHRRQRKISTEVLPDEPYVAPHLSEEPQDEVSDAILTALSASTYSENGQRKRVSWSQERTEQLPAGSTRRHVSPVVAGTFRRTPAPAAALLASRGRPLRREEDAEDLSEDQVEAERRNASRASRRSVGMVLLGVGMLFGIGRYAGVARPVVRRGLKTGEVLVPTSNLDLSFATGSLGAEGLSNDLSDSTSSFIEVVLPPLTNDAAFSQQRQPDEDMSYDRVIGRIFAWLCTTLYLTSRLPQIWKNYVRKSVEGLSIYLFIFAFLGNFFYVLSIITSPEANLPPPASTEFYRESFPYLLGSGGTFVFDITIVTQSLIYRGKRPRRWSIVRSRGNSLVRSAALAEETAGLLHGDVLAAARAQSEWARAEGRS